MTPRGSLYVTDTPDRAARYANASASGKVSKNYESLREGAAIAEIETAPVEWMRRPVSHPTLDECEAMASEWRVTRVTLRPHAFRNTLHGKRGNYVTLDDIIAALRDSGVEVEIV